MGGDAGGEDVGWLGPAWQRFMGFLVKVASDNPRYSAHAGHSALNFLVNLRVELAAV